MSLSRVFLAVVLAGLCVSAQEPAAPGPTAKQLALVQAIGRQLEDSDGVMQDPALSAYLTRLVEQVAAAVPAKPVEVRVTRTWRPYADVLPQGVLYLSAGMFDKLENEAQLVGLLAHELAHKRATVLTASPDGQTIPLYVPACGFFSPLVAGYGLRAGQSSSRREAEIEATKAAMAAVERMGYDPRAIVDLVASLPRMTRLGVREVIVNLRGAAEAAPTPVQVNSSEFVARQAAVRAALVQVANPPSLFRNTGGSDNAR
jgi:predicted Zn-dependent protease